MGLRSPFDYSGYEVTMAEVLINLLEKFCSGCHTNEDYRRHCKGCPAGQLIYRCRKYLLEIDEVDNRYAMYASDEWQAKRKEAYDHEDSQEQRQEWLSLSKACQPECDIIRAIKEELIMIEPHPLFYANWIGQDARKPDPLLKLRELVKDLKFIESNRFQSLLFRGEYEMRAKLRMREELEPLLLAEEQKVEAEIKELEAKKQT
jgi:hypothetical protein